MCIWKIFSHWIRIVSENFHLPSLPVIIVTYWATKLIIQYSIKLFGKYFFSGACNCHYIDKLILFQKGDSGGPLVCADGSSSKSKDYLFGVYSASNGFSNKALWKIENGKLINKVWSYKKLSNNY